MQFRRASESILDSIAGDVRKFQPGFESVRGYGETYEEEPFMGYYIYPEVFRDLKKKSRSFQIWFGFLYDTSKKKTYLEVEAFFYPPSRFYRETIRRHMGKAYDAWFTRLESRGWRFYDEEDGSVCKPIQATKVIGRRRTLASQQKAVLEFVNSALIDLREVKTYSFVRRALRMYHP